MKKTLTTLFSLVSLYALGQTALPQVFRKPLTGYDRIRDENPYIIEERATDETATNWMPYSRLLMVKSPIFNLTVEDRTSTWEAGVWKDELVRTDSLVSETDHIAVKTNFNYYKYDRATLQFEQKRKCNFTYNSDKRPSQIMVQIANPTASENYVNSYKITIQYNAVGQRIKDTYQFYNQPSISYVHYTYNGENKVTREYTLTQTGDTVSNIYYSYTPENRLFSINQFHYDNDIGSWMPYSADSFEYNTAGEISKHIEYLTYSNTGTAPTFRPFGTEEYTYSSTGKLSEILTQNWTNEAWTLSSKRVFTYVNDKPTVGYYYLSNNGTTININPSFRYTFTTLTGNENLNSAFTNLSVYPNPSNQELTIDLGSGKEGTVSLFDFKGKQRFTKQIDGSLTFETTELPAGIYLLKLQSGTEQTMRKIVISH